MWAERSLRRTIKDSEIVDGYDGASVHGARPGEEQILPFLRDRRPDLRSVVEELKR